MSLMLDPSRYPTNTSINLEKRIVYYTYSSGKEKQPLKINNIKIYKKWRGTIFQRRLFETDMEATKWLVANHTNQTEIKTALAVGVMKRTPKGKISLKKGKPILDHWIIGEWNKEMLK